MRLKDSIYAYGLWEKGLPSNLLWFVKSKANRSSTPLRIPSWSWASTTGAVKFVPYSKENKDRLYCIANFTGTESLLVEGRVREVSQIGDLAQPANMDLISKSLTSSTSFFFDSYAHLICDDRHEPIGFAVLDEHQRPSDGPVYCLAVTRENFRFESPLQDGHTFFVLLLQTLPGRADTFTRIGMGSISPPLWFEDTLPREINII